MKYRFLKSKFYTLVFFFAPYIAYAAPKTFADLVNVVLGIIDQLVLLLVALSFLVVAWGMIKMWILNAGSEESVEKGKQIAFAGVIGLVVITSVWGIVRLLSTSLF